MRRPEGVTIIAVYHFIVALPLLIGACAIVGVPLSGALQYADEVGRFWALFGLGIGFFTVLGFALVGIVAGWGLLRLKSWARWLTVILSVLSLPLFPIGTLIGAVIIWYLLQDHVREAFEEGGVKAPAVAASVVEPEPAEAPAPVVEAAEGEPETEEDPPYVIPPSLDPEGTAETLLDSEGAEAYVEEVAAGAEQTLVELEAMEAQTLISEPEAAEDEADDEPVGEAEAAPETMILSEEELAQAQEPSEATEEEDEVEDEEESK